MYQTDFLLLLSHHFSGQFVVYKSTTFLTNKNINDLERTQKSFGKLVLKEEYKTYENGLLQLNLESLELRRQELILRFAKNGIKKNTLNDLFPVSKRKHPMDKRNKDKYVVNFANTDRLKNGSIITMQNLLNNDAKKISV